MAGMDERKSDERKAVDSVVRWLRIRERSGHPAPTSYAELVDAIGHSALLRRLLAGKTPLRVPPPRSFGQPWYSLIECGGADGCDANELLSRVVKEQPALTSLHRRWLTRTASPPRLVLRPN